MLQCPIDIKLLVCLALHCMATSVIIAHNHPSGPLKPSIKDEEMTKKIRLALELIDVKFIDYFVISDKEYLSFQNEGLM
jgi:DNA repair protein RadC